MERLSIEQEYDQMRIMLNEKQWRQYLATEAKRRGSAIEVATEAGVSLNTVKRGRRELARGDSYRPGERIRKPGGGRKKLVHTDATLLADLEGELEPKGDPMSLLRWTTRSLAHLVKAMADKGHQIGKSALAEVLHEQGFSLRANKKNIEGKPHPDRDAQFAHINSKCQEFEEKGAPIISVDCKKKERNWWAISRTMGEYGRPKEKRPRSMYTTLLPWLMAKPCPMGYTTWSTRGDL